MLVSAALLLASSLGLPSKVAVVGPTGKLGRIAVQRLVKDGVQARILLRHPVMPEEKPSSIPVGLKYSSRNRWISMR